MKITSINKSELYNGYKNKRRRIYKPKTATKRAVTFNESFQDVFELSSEAENHFQNFNKSRIYKKKD